ncbi:MAG: hypothetical protein FWH33_05435 [Oscillospiraceae bacterium]|nr:hypothetical protein [Oscillospiraceae bacterium]
MGQTTETMAKGEYDWLFYKFKKEETPSDGMLPQYQAYFRGELSIPGAQTNQPYRAYMKTGFISSEPHFHRDEEYLAFVGHDLRYAFDSFEAEVELWMGESPEDMEKIVITAPTMVRVPGYYWHGPIEIKKLSKPLFFQPVLFSSRYYAIRRRKDADGKIYNETIVDGMSPCTLDNDKVCTFCGKCEEKN